MSPISIFRKKIGIIGVIIFLVLVLGFGILFKIFEGSGGLMISSYYPNDLGKWQEIFESSGNDDGDGYSFDEKPLSVVFPYDEEVLEDLNMFYSAMADVANPSVVVVVGSADLAGNEIYSCGNCYFSTIFGDLEVQNEYVNEFREKGLISLNTKAFVGNFSVSAHAPFIKNYFPNAEIVPLLIDPDADVEEITALSSRFVENLPPDALVIGSTGFSRTVNNLMNELHDKAAFSTISNYDFKNVFDLDVDFPGVIYLVMDFSKKMGYEDVSLLKRIITQDPAEEMPEEANSYSVYGFFEGEFSGDDELRSESVTILNFGNIYSEDFMFLDSWEWEPGFESMVDESFKKQLRDIRGADDNFFRGVDFLAFDLNDGGCEIREKNGLKISFCKFSEEKDYEENPYDVVALQDGVVDLVYLLYEFGGEELSKEQREIAREFVERGVDVFVGRGFSEVMPFENHKDGLIFYSLGDFVPDSGLLNELTSVREGVVLGLNIDEETISIFFFAVDVTNGYPKLKSFSENSTDFVKFISGLNMANFEGLDRKAGLLNYKR